MIKVNQLPEAPPIYVMLRCSGCGSTFSATRGDYFDRDPNEVMKCQCILGHDLSIVTRKTIFDHEAGEKYLND